MASYEEVIQALRNADAAGDTAAAKRLAQIADKMRQEPAQQPQSSFRGALQNVMSGATFGFNDEIQSGIAGVKGMVTGEGFGPAYDRKLAQARAEESQFRDKHPILGTGLTVAGAIPTTVATLGVGGGAGAMTIPRLLGLGAAEGGLAGYGSAEGGTGERLKGAATGAAVGGATAGALSAALPVASTGLRAVRAGFRGRQGRAEDRATRKIHQAFRRDDAHAHEIADIYQHNQARNPKPEMLADLAGENTRDLAAAAHSIPGRAKNQAEERLVQRQMGELRDPTARGGQAGRVIQDAERALVGGPAPSAMHTTDELVAARRAAAGPAYQRAIDESGPIDIFPVLDHIDDRLTVARGPVRAAIERARRLLHEPGTQEPETRLAALHEAKIALDDMMERGPQNSLGNTARRELREIQTRLLEAMDADSGGLYGQARAQFAGPSQSIRAVEMGRAIFNEQAEMTAREIRRMPPADREFFTVGVIQAVRDQAMGTANTGDVVRRLIGNPRLRERLGAAVPNPTDFTNFVFDLEREASMSRTLARTRGSRTTPLRETIDDAGQNAAIGAVADVATGNKLGLARRAIQALTGNGKLDEATAEQLSGMLLNPQNVQPTLEHLQAYDRQIMRMIARRRAIAEAMARTTGAQGQNVNQETDASLQRFGFR
jgi:hypothetical protein